MRCFVISPIEQPGSETREHADDVFECIIEPALKEAKSTGAAQIRSKTLAE